MKISGQNPARGNDGPASRPERSASDGLQNQPGRLQRCSDWELAIVRVSDNAALDFIHGLASGFGDFELCSLG